MSTRPRPDGSTRALRAIDALLRPVVRICLRCGISTGEIRALIERAFVREAAQFLRDRGERVTLVRVSAVSGIARQSVKNLLARSDDDLSPRSDTQLHRALRVLWGWHDDPDFYAADGQPRELLVSGSASSFETLVKRYGGGVTYQSVLEHLVSTGSVSVSVARGSPAKRVRLLRADVHPESGTDASIDELFRVLGDVLRVASRVRPESALPELKSHALRVAIPISAAGLASARLDRRAELVMQSIDEALQNVMPATSAPSDGQGRQETETLDVHVTLIIGMSSERLGVDTMIRDADSHSSQSGRASGRAEVKTGGRPKNR